MSARRSGSGSAQGFRQAFRHGISLLLVTSALPSAARDAGLAPAAFVSVTGFGQPLTTSAWIVASGDARGRPFIIVDKASARVLAFDGTGVLVSETPALIGFAIGDISPPGIGTMKLADITPALRVTPAGRYEAHMGENLAGKRILWVDYDAALSLHPVATGNVAERRLERLATRSVADNRISYGCINVPAHFFSNVVEPLFAADNGMVYILPEGPDFPIRE